MLQGGGHNKFWGSFYPVARSFSHIEGGVKKFPLFIKGGREKLYPVSRGGAQKVADQHSQHFAEME